MRRQELKTNIAGYIQLLPALIVMVLFSFYPVIWSFLITFKNIRIIQLQKAGIMDIPGKFIGLDNFIKVFNNDLFIKSILNSGYFAIIFIPVTVIGAMLLALFVNKNIKGINFFRTVTFIPYVISVISCSLIFLTLFNNETGLINAVLYKMNIGSVKWLSNRWLAMPVIAIMSVWRRVGYFMLLYLAGLQNIPSSLYEAASIDGATGWQKFIKITIPFLGKISTVVFIMLLRDVLTVFQEVYVMTGGGPANSTVTVPYLIYQEAFQYYRMGTAAAMSYLLFVIAVVISLLQIRLTKKYSN